MEHCTSEPMAGAWYLAGAPEPMNDQQGSNPPEPGDSAIIPNVIISVSLDELDGLSGDMLV